MTTSPNFFKVYTHAAYAPFFLFTVQPILPVKDWLFLNSKITQVYLCANTNIK